MIKKAKPVMCDDPYYGSSYTIENILVERESILSALIYLKHNWGSTKGYERLKEYIQDMEA